MKKYYLRTDNGGINLFNTDLENLCHVGIGKEEQVYEYLIQNDKIVSLTMIPDILKDAINRKVMEGRE